MSTRLVAGTNISNLDKVERGYDNMDHYAANFERERRALLTIDFVKGREYNEYYEYTTAGTLSSPPLVFQCSFTMCPKSLLPVP